MNHQRCWNVAELDAMRFESLPDLAHLAFLWLWLGTKRQIDRSINGSVYLTTQALSHIAIIVIIIRFTGIITHITLADAYPFTGHSHCCLCHSELYDDESK